MTIPPACGSGGRSSHRSVRLFAASLALTCLHAPAQAIPAQGGGLDLAVSTMQVNQTVQAGTTPLVARRSTMVRVPVEIVAGALLPGQEVDGILRVYVGGVETADSPVYSLNGPFVPPAVVDLKVLDHTLNFAFLPPEASGVALTVEVNPAGPGQLAEVRYTNNTATSLPLDFACKRTLELVYVPIDYRPGGGPTPNPPDPQLIEPGVGDNFIQGIYPGADWEYHRSDAPSKLWTSSLSFSGSALNAALAADLQLMSPKPDFIYGWVPGSLPYNGMAMSSGAAAMGNTEPIRHQRTAAHELGHLFGLSHNNKTIGVAGIDVEHHLNLTQALSVVKDPTLKDIMAAGLQTKQAWIWPGNYKYFQNHHKFQCVTPLTGSISSGETLMVSGLWDRSANTAEFLGAITFEEGDATPTVPVSQADLVFRVWAEGTVYEVGIAVPDELESCAGAESSHPTSPVASFAVVFPPALVPSTVGRVSVVDAVSDRVLADLLRSPSAPELDITSPTPHEALADELRVRWQGRDADGDELRYYLRYSPDGERIVPLATNVAASEWELDLSRLPALRAGRAFFELLATDGLNTTRRRIAPLRLQPKALAGVNNRPWVHILTPDNGKSFPKAASVILHSSGWDLEDRALTGTSIVWSSDLDGPIGTGRLLTVSSLSVGTHVISVTAIDSGGVTDGDSTTVTITDRPLPGGGVTCQQDLGFGGPGGSTLSLCGGDLSPGKTADLLLTGAAASQPAFLAASLTSNPTPALGGTIVPLPIVTIVSGATGAGGNWPIGTVAGGMMPGPFYLQAAYLDAGQVAGFGISNALRVVILP